MNNIKEEKICRLCLKTDSKFEAIDETTKEVIDVILSLNVNLDISENPIICWHCAKVLQKTLFFLSICVDTEEILSFFADSNNNTNIDLRNIYKGQDLQIVSGNICVCRLCLKQKKISNFVSIDSLKREAVFVDMLPRFMHQIDFTLVKNPVICKRCRYNLDRYFKFALKCLDTEEKINKYCKDIGNSNGLMLSSVFHPLIDNNFKFPDKCTTMNVVKQEPGTTVKLEIIHDELIKNEDSLDMKEVPLKEKWRNEENDDSNFGMFGCSRLGKMELDSCKANIKREETSKCRISTRKRRQTTKMPDYRDCNCDMKQDKCIKCRPHLYILYLKSGWHKCSLCGHTTKQKSNINTHIRSHSRVKQKSEIQICGYDMCGYKTKKRTAIRLHMMTHEDPSKVDMHCCTKCSYKSVYRGNVNRHMLTHEDISNLKEYKCASCQFVTFRKDSLKNHIYYEHKLKAAYKCSLCSYQSTHRYRIKKHMVVHKCRFALQVFKCASCNFKTHRKDCLIPHMLCHKKISEVEIYKCSKCTFETRRKNNLRQHVLHHKRTSDVMHKCPFCEYQTHSRNYLEKRHIMLIHGKAPSAEMLFKCADCSFETKRKDRLKSHIVGLKCKSPSSENKIVMKMK